VVDGAPAPFEYRPSLDGIRAVAALLVILFHAGTLAFGHGYVGVDVFFVLSGFLITSLLAREVFGTGSVRFIAFYARRVRRLLPAALLVLLVTAAAYELVASPAAVSEARGGFVASALYYANWFFLGQSHDYFAQGGHPSPVEHYWSLSVEEQFYLVWPALVLGLVLLARRCRLRLDLAAAALALAGVIYAGVLAGTDPMASYFGTPARAYQLLLGAAVAFLCVRRERPGRTPRRRVPAPPGAATVAAAGIALVLVAGTPLLGTASAYWHGVAAATGTGLLIFGLELAPGSLTGRGLAWAPARLVGRWSYAAYLWHWPVIVVGDEAGFLPDGWVGRTAVVVVLTLLLAGATFYLVERPTHRITLRTFPRQRLIAAAGVAVAAAMALVLPPVLQVGAGAQALLEEANAAPSRLAAIRKTAENAPTILLVGDSHADVLYAPFARLAREQGWSLVASSEWACPWPRVQATLEGVDLDCDSMRREALQEAAKRHPEIAVLVSRSIVVRPLQIDGEFVDPGGSGWIEEVRRGTESFLADLQPLVGRVLIIEPLPETSAPMIDCLVTGAAPTACSAPAVNQPGTEALEASWRRIADVKTLSLDNLICPERICSAMLNGIPTYRNTDHLTIAFSRQLAHSLDAYLRFNGIVLARGEVRTSQPAPGSTPLD
jgi:peptidoglycan/LPS O-acetylase OafA/YrhL